MRSDGQGWEAKWKCTWTSSGRLCAAHLAIAVGELVACAANVVQRERRLAGRHIDAKFAHDLSTLNDHAAMSVSKTANGDSDRHWRAITAVLVMALPANLEPSLCICSDILRDQYNMQQSAARCIGAAAWWCRFDTWYSCTFRNRSCCICSDGLDRTTWRANWLNMIASAN